MSKQFFSELGQNYMEILEDDEYYDVTIEVDIFMVVSFPADQLLLQELIDYLQKYLIENKSSG
ncbi:hypothetical protein RhiirA4_483346 [Rhizophagus irregularis]|uniref:Uncharacterized protein n=1 Tax=Rhizophagus irregularis TaxID=588596 RepID=A0A2I1HMI6_9GLOM|nr:hypothetical protein RhiirA4_483346 [Rhizophagus irregularis]